MEKPQIMEWEKKIVSPAEVMEKITPGANIFLGTGAAEPRTLVCHLMDSDAVNLQDLEFTQLVSLGDAITLRDLQSQKFRLKTFFSGWVAGEAFTQGRVDLIPSRFAKIPDLIESGRISIDIAFIQITPPDQTGFCSLGVAVDVAQLAMDQARLVVGEINPMTPRTFGDTFVPISNFDLLVRSTEEPICFPRWKKDENFEQVAANLASVIEDGSCLGFSIGPLYETLCGHLSTKRNLGIHSPFITDALMDLIKSGAVTNRYKGIYRGKSLVSYAFGSRDLLDWLDLNPLIEFQRIDLVFNPLKIGENPNFIAILPARKVDITGRIALHFGKGTVSAAPGEASDFINGAELSKGGRTVFALTSRNLRHESNILMSVEHLPNQMNMRESTDMIVTEYGVANLRGRSIRERTQAIIDIAHPDDRKELVEKARENHILYHDQIFMYQGAHLYPAWTTTRHTFKGTEIQLRSIKPSDEEEMRHLFYRFSDQTVYYRYFASIKAMPHTRMQEYVNVDFNRTMSIVALAGQAGQEHIIAEARFVRHRDRPYGDIAFVVDENHQGLGIGSYLYNKLIHLGKQAGLKGFTADVLATNKPMMKVFEQGDLPVHANLDSGVYELTIDFYATDRHTSQ